MLDYIQYALETAANIVKYGWSPTAAILSIVALFRVRKIRKKLAKRLPWLMDEDSETKHYIANQQRIEQKIDLLLSERGLTWNASISNPTKPPLARASAISKVYSWAAGLAAQSVLRRGMSLFINSNTKGLKKMKSKFTSRKFWMAVVTGVLIVLNDGLNLGIDSETVLAFAGIVATFIIGEAAVDAKRAGGSNEGNYSDTDHSV